MNEKKNTMTPSNTYLKKRLLLALPLFCLFSLLFPGSKDSARSLAAKSVERKAASNNGEVSVSPVEATFGKVLIHPNWTHKQMPPADRTGPGDDTVMLLGIFSTILEPEKEAETRQMIRDTYLSYNNDSRVCSLQDYMRLRDNNTESANTCKVVYTFVIGGREEGPSDHYRSKEPLTIDPALFKNIHESDVTYLNIKENMNEGKTTTWFKYCASLFEEYGFDYSAKADEDTMINMPHFLDFIITDLAPYPYNVRIFGGNFIRNARQTRVGHIYASGQFYFLSSDMTAFVSSDELDRESIIETRLARKSPSQLKPRNEDLDMGTHVHHHPYPVKFVQMSQRVVYIHKVKTVERWMELWREVEGLPPITRVIGMTQKIVSADSYATWKKGNE